MNINKKYINEVLYFQFKALDNLYYINHLFTSRIGWNKGNTRENISNIFKVEKDNIVDLRQVHGTDIMVIDEETEDFKKVSILERDGLITNIDNIVLTTYHADCVPIYFVDKKERAIGLAHGGWKGSYNNITGEIINNMKKVYGSRSENIIVAVGPCIGPCCYEVGEDLGRQFSSRYKEFKDIVEKRNNKIYLNLWKLNYLQALDKGVEKKNIIVSEMCTSCRVDKFYSYRKENGIKNRMIAAISLKEN